MTYFGPFGRPCATCGAPSLGALDVDHPVGSCRPSSSDYTTQGLINSGMAWHLEGSVGRACMDAIESGRAILGREGHRDYWGNYVPSRYQVEPGTKGSLLYANDIRLDNGLPLLTEDGFDAGLGDEPEDD